MKRASLVRVLASGLLLGSVIFVGCKDKEEPASVPVPSGGARGDRRRRRTTDHDDGRPGRGRPGREHAGGEPAAGRAR
jgi:hypothetical protein